VARSLRGWKGLGRGSFLRQVRGQDSLLLSLGLQKGILISRFCSPVYNIDIVFLLYQAKGRLAVCSVTTN